MTEQQAMRMALEALEDRSSLMKWQSARNALRQALEQQPADDPVAMNWSVFNTGAEVWDKLSLADAVVELTPARLERGWSAVCVINKDNPPLYTRPQPIQEHAEQLAKLNWQYFECPACGSEGAKAFPKPAEHITDGSPCWCAPEINYTDPKTGASVIVHREPQ